MMFGCGRGKSRENVKRAERANEKERLKRETEEREMATVQTGLKYIYFLYHCATVQF